MEWPQFNEEVKQLRAISDRGQYRLLQQFSHYSVSASKWAKMRPEQRREVIAQFDKATMKNKQLSAGSSSATSTQPSQQLCVE